MIDEFRSSFTESLSQPSRFRVKFNPGTGTTRLNKILDTKTLTFRCESASLPGRTLATADMRIYGPVEKYPYLSTYDDMTLTFICTDTLAEKQFFNQWMEIINPQNSWNFNYKKNYVMNIDIEQYDNMENIVHTIRLVDAFPVSSNEMNLDWSSVDTYHKLSVTFAYTYWTRVVVTNGYEPELESTDSQVISDIPSLLTGADSISQRQGTYLNLTNQTIGPFDAIKDQYASAVNNRKQTLNYKK